MELCTPALVYLVLSAISFVATAQNNSASTLFVNALFVLLWTFLLNVLCQRGFTALSWILVLLPIIVLVIMVFFIGQAALSGKLSAGSPSAVAPSAVAPSVGSPSSASH
jgi:hypothetical protein